MADSTPATRLDRRPFLLLSEEAAQALGYRDGEEVQVPFRGTMLVVIDRLIPPGEVWRIRGR